MERIDIKKAQAIAKNKGLKPGKVKGTDGVQFTKGKNDRLDVITWDEFEAVLAKRKLAAQCKGIRAWPKEIGSGPILVGVRGFKSLPLHHLPFLSFVQYSSMKLWMFSMSLPTCTPSTNE